MLTLGTRHGMEGHVWCRVRWPLRLTIGSLTLPRQGTSEAWKVMASEVVTHGGGIPGGEEGPRGAPIAWGQVAV